MLESPNRCSWYTVPVTDPPGKKSPLSSEVLSPVPGMEDCDLETAVAFPPRWICSLGGSSRPYIARGRRFPRKDDFGIGAKCIDVSKLPEAKWDILPDMHTPRDFPSAVVHGDKIYVVGGVRFALPCYYAEIYDVSRGTWNPMFDLEEGVPPPVFDNIPGGLFSDENGRKYLLFCCDRLRDPNTIYTLDLEKLSVEYAENPFPYLYHGSVVVDGLLYAYIVHTRDIRAYDVNKKIWISGGVQGLETMGRCEMLRLVHVGGKRLGLIYKDMGIGGPEEPEEDDKHGLAFRFKVTVFEVERNHQDGGGLKAKVFSDRRFRIPGLLGLHDCLIL